TEYGSHSTPEGPQRQTEMRQARNIAQRSVVLYSNGVQGLVPHIAVSSESNPTYWDDWLGLFRRNEEPKPAIIAHATAARMIDGSDYLGDLWFGPAVEAMVFDRKGTLVLALWHIDPTLDGSEENASRKQIEIPATGDLMVTGILGRETVHQPENGVVTLTLDESPIYVTGFSEDLLADVSRELRPDRWPEDQLPPRPVRKAGKFQSPPTLDGKLDEWKHAVELAFVNEAVNAKDASGIAYISWDDTHLYIGAYMRDNEILNKRVLGKLYQQDSIELFVSTEPRDSGSGFGPNDHQFFLTPASPLDRGLVAEMTQRESGEVELVEDAVYFAGPSGWGWAVEVGIPWSRFNDFTPEPGSKLMLDMRLNDADSSHERWKLDPGDNDRFSVFDPVTWGFVELVE
nr:hypothetical protein [Kiritimatiellia bacterium]